MPNFSYLNQLEVKPTSTVDYVLHEITVNGKTPVLEVAPATDANTQYFNELLKRGSRTQRQVKAGKVNSGMIAENRDEDRTLYPKYVIKGWRDMLDADGTEVKFTVNNATDFLAQLPDWLFDNVRSFCGEPQNFTETLDVEVSSKN